MKLLVIFSIFLLLCTLKPLVADEAADEKDVKVLTDKNFADTIKGSKFALVEFYAPWCGHCKKLAPNYAAAATKLLKEGVEVILAKVDATVEKEVAAQYGIQGFPTLKWFVDGNVNKSLEYGGGRETDEIVKWVQKKTGPAVTEVNSPKDLEKLEKASAVVLLAYVKDTKDPLAANLETASRSYDDVTFGVTTQAAVAKAAGLKNAPSLTVIQNFEGESRTLVPYTLDNTDSQDIELFVSTKQVPLVVPLSPQYYNKIFGSDIKKQILVIGNKKQVLGNGKEAKAVKNVASKFEGKLLFVSVDQDDANMAQVLQFFGLSAKKEVSVVGFKSSDSSKFVPDFKFSESALLDFSNKFADDKLEKTLKSQDIPEKDVGEDGLKIVVGKSFEKIVKSPDHDVFLEIYAPWCGHCKALLPTLEKLATEYKDNKSIVIAKMDGTENEVNDFAIQGYPSLFFFPAGKDSQYKQYEGADRSLESLKTFIESNAKLPIDKKDSDGKDEL